MTIRRHMTLSTWTRLATAAVVAALFGATYAVADPWNDKTRMRFSSSVMVPGATLDPGEYVFKLMDFETTRHMVQILNSDESKLIAVTQAIPVKRQDPEGTTTLTFAASEEGQPVALKAWYYPGTAYGHEFIYTGEEAREIAQRTKTLVLAESDDYANASKGSLRLYSADGTQREWQSDAAVVREWTDWTRGAVARAKTATDAAQDDAAREATAPMVEAGSDGMRVDVGTLEENPRKYMGQTISVDAEVEKVLGPRLFSIDEPNWADLSSEVLVYMPTALATLVRPDDLVTVTGTMRPFVKAELQDEWAWLGVEPDSVELKATTILVATRIVGGDGDRALYIAKPAGREDASRDTRTAPATGAQARQSQREQQQQPYGQPRQRQQSAQAGQQQDARQQQPQPYGQQQQQQQRQHAQEQQRPVATVDAVTRDAVGRMVALEDVKVDRVLPGRGFYVSSGDTSVFVRRADGQGPSVQQGQTVSIDAYVLTLPRAMRDHVENGGDKDVADVYLYATQVS